MRVEQIYTGSMLRNFSYLIEAKNGYYCVDPYDSKQILKKIAARNSKLLGIINTHDHWDHTKGNKELVKKTNCNIYCHHEAKISGDLVKLRKGEQIDLGDDFFLEILETPGHTFSHICLLLRNETKAFAVFTGDTLFNAGVGNTRNGGNTEILFETIENIFGEIQDDVKVYPGHEYLGNNLAFALTREPGNQDVKTLLKKWETIDWSNEVFHTNMAMERKVNPFLRLDSKEIQDQLEDKPTKKKEVFLQLRKLRDQW